MADRLPDLADVLHAAEDQRTRSLVGTPTDDVLARTHAALRTTRRRRTALAVTGAAAAVAVAVAGVLTWQPQGDVQPAGPEPTPLDLPGVGPLRPATEEEVRDAPHGSVVVLWQQDSYREVAGDRGGSTRALTDGDTWFLLVLPDGTVRQLAPAPDGLETLLSWDPATATVSLAPDGEHAYGSRVVDLLTGRVVDAQEGAPVPEPTSPDGTREAYIVRQDQGLSLAVRAVDGSDVRHLPLPAPRCAPAHWLDDARIVTTCSGEGPVQVASVGSEVVVVDAATGAALDRRPLPEVDDQSMRAWPSQLADGTVVLPVSRRDGDVCRTRIDRLTEDLALVPLGEVPFGASSAVLTGTVDRVLVAGPATCWESTGTGVWALDTATGDVTEVLPVTSWPDGPAGVLDWAR